MSTPKIMLFLFALIIQGCVTSKTNPQPHITLQPPATSTALFQHSYALPELAEFFYLTEQQQQGFLDYFHSPEQGIYGKEQRIYNYLQNKLIHFTYEGANNTAQLALEKQQGNCMSLALLTSALATLGNVEIGHKLIYQEPLMDYEDNIFVSSDHIRTYLYKEEQQTDPVMRRAALVIDYFPESTHLTGQSISPSRFHAMLYNNLAADALFEGNSDKAFYLSLEALKHDATFTPAVNIIALMYKRKKAFSEAQQWFEYGAQLQDDQITLLTNYHAFAVETGNQHLAGKINQRLIHNKDSNPYSWLALALEAERNQHYGNAKLYYKKLLEKAPYLHNANLALIRLYLKEQNFNSAQRLVEQAMQYAYEPARLEFYNAKLSALKQLRQPLHQVD